MKRRTFFILAGGAIGGVAFFTFKDIFMKTKPIIQPITLKILSPFRDVFIENNIDPSFYLKDEDDSRPGFSFENLAVYNDLKLTNYDVTINHNGHSLHLPLAVAVYINIGAGYIRGYTISLPEHYVSLSDALAMSNDIANGFKSMGGTQTYFPKEPITARTVAESNTNSKFHSIWKLPVKGVKAGTYFESIIRIVSSRSFTGSTLPPLAAFVTRSTQDPAAYMIKVDVSTPLDVFKELMKVEDARRLAVTGRTLPDNSIPLQLWYDDPSWRPAGWDGKYI